MERAWLMLLSLVLSSGFFLPVGRLGAAAEKNVSGSTSVTLRGALPFDTELTAHVISRNEHGSSIPSNNVTFFKRHTDRESKRPKTASDLHVEWVESGSAKVSWNWNWTREDGSPVSRARFIVSYAPEVADNLNFTNVETDNKTWILLRGLQLNVNYVVHVVVEDWETKKQSERSESISLPVIKTGDIPHPPTITFSPDRSIFEEGESLTVTCKSQGGRPTPTLTLSVPGLSLKKDGTGSVTLEVKNLTRQAGVGKVECTADNGKGHPKKSTHLLSLQYGPETSAVGQRTVTSSPGYDVKLECSVLGMPAPQVSWFFGDDQLRNGHSDFVLEHQSKRPDLIIYTLVVRTAKKLSGAYRCQACNKNQKRCHSTNFTLTVPKFLLPMGPDHVEKCCRDQGVKEACMSACTMDINLKQYEKSDCIAEFMKLLHCAKDGMDHRQCCRENEVPEMCLGPCDLTLAAQPLSSEDLRRCSNYQPKLLNCMYEGREKLPGLPKGVKAARVNATHFRVVWSPPDINSDNISYVVYYKAKGEKDYKLKTENETESVIEGRKANSTYEITVLAMNDHGFSHYTELQFVSLAPVAAAPIRSGGVRNVAGTALAVIFCFLLAAVIILAVIYFTRRPSRFPAFFAKLRNRHGFPGESVAFENPGYDREGQIRGLPGGDAAAEDSETTAAFDHRQENGNWEPANLEAPPDSPALPNRGLRYTQLTS